MSVTSAPMNGAVSVNDAYTRRINDRTRKNVGGTPRGAEAPASTRDAARAAAVRTSLPTPDGMDGELWQSLSSDELDHFMRPAATTLLFGAGYTGSSRHAGVPRGMHLDIRA